MHVQFIRSPRSRYIRIIDTSIGEVMVINVKDSGLVKYPTDGGLRLTFYTNFTFLVDHTYSVLLDPGYIIILNHVANHI